MNDDGLVTIEEWRKAISELGLRAEQQETDAVFKAIADGSDVVDPAELQDLLFHGLMAPKEEEVGRGKFVRKRIRVAGDLDGQVRLWAATIAVCMCGDQRMRQFNCTRQFNCFKRCVRAQACKSR